MNYFLSLVILAVATTEAFQVATTTNLLVSKVVHQASPFPLVVAPQLSKSARRASLFHLLMSDGDTSEGEGKEDKKISGRKRRVTVGYRAASLAYLTTSPWPLVKMGITAFTCYAAAGPILASVVAYVLSNAALDDQLRSDTYKRLNLSLAAYSIAGLVVAAVEPKYFCTPRILVPALLALVNSVKGYGYGVLGWDKNSGSDPVQDLIRGMKESVNLILRIPSNVSSAVYLAATLTVGSLKLAKLCEIAKLLSVGLESHSFLVATRLYRFAKLALFTAVLFTLKDAADEGHLEETPIVALNIVSSFVFGTMAFYLFQQRGQAALLGCATGFFSLFAAFNGVKAGMQRT